MTLNPYSLKGIAAPGIAMLFESLMTKSLDEPETLYGLVAESVKVAEDGSAATFTIRKEARWHDGTPITPEDVVFTLDLLKTKGDPVYRIVYADIDKAEKTGEHQVTFTFKDTKNRELPLLAATMPILSKAYYSNVDFTKTTLESPLGSGPYNVASVDQGRSIVYERMKNYWGNDLPVNVGHYNFDRICYDIYRDETVSLEAFKAGDYDFREEYISRNWATAYNIPAVKQGRLKQELVRHYIPPGMQAFIFNQRKNKFKDRRVREAIGLTMDFEWLNKSLFYNQYQHTNRFFQNTLFEFSGIPEGEELALLAANRDILPAALFTQPFVMHETDGSGHNRDGLRKAQALLNEAGWVIKNGKRVHSETGEVLVIEFMLRQATLERIVAVMKRHLARLGIVTSIRIVDDAQYQKRLETGDYDMTSLWYGRGIHFPGNEQVSFWHSSQADVPGSNNIAGLKHKAVDDLLDKLVVAEDLETLTPIAKALDRVLMWEHVVIPHWYRTAHAVLYWERLQRPASPPRYALGFSTWWIAEDTP
jgi:microcin C transport system substrate-binding protein